MRTREKDSRHSNTQRPPTPNTQHEDKRRELGLYLMLGTGWLMANYAILDTFPILWNNNEYLGIFIVAQIIIALVISANVNEEKPKESPKQTILSALSDVIDAIYDVFNHK